MKVRSAIIDDADEIFNIEKKVFENHWSLKSIKSEFTNSKYSKISVLEVEGKIIGYIFQRTIENQRHIINVAIDTPFQHKGYGKFLLKKILEENSDDTNVFLEVKEANFPAIKLYINLGFEELQKKDSYYSDGSNAIFMLKRNNKHDLV
tara:strand:+ start:10072 stop:10518 length:447 start_codon:yes stop_codon:yes gene_type:complete